MALPLFSLPDPAAERERHEARRHPDREILELAAAGAARTFAAGVSVNTHGTHGEHLTAGA